MPQSPLIRYAHLTPVGRPMLAELRDEGPMDEERLQDALMFDEGQYENALNELTTHGLVIRKDDGVEITGAGIRVVDEERNN